MNRRAGLSLAEVLIAMFVLALGLMGVLSLFPLGAVRMAQAIKDDRTAIHNLNVGANMRWVWKEERKWFGPIPENYLVPTTENDRALNTRFRGTQPYPWPALRLDPFCNAMEDPNYPWNPDLGPAGEIPAAFQSPLYPGPVTFTSPITVIRRGDRRPSYPVYIDPVGWNNGSYAGLQQYWVAGRIDCIPRRSLRRIEWLSDANNYYTINPDTLYPGLKRILRSRYFIMLDDIGFGRDGTPLDSTGNTTSYSNPNGLAGMSQQVQRDGRYTCGILLRRPNNNNTSTMDMTVVVYSGRATDGPSDEIGFTTKFRKGSTEAIVYYDATNGPRPKLRKNSWILDGTMVWQVNGNWVPDNFLHPDHGRFYRVIGVTENVAGEMIVELQEPAAENSFYTDASGNETPYGVGVVMDNVVEVFPSKSLSPNTRPVP